MSSNEEENDGAGPQIPPPTPPQAKLRLGPPPMTMREDFIEEITVAVQDCMRVDAQVPVFKPLLTSARVHETSGKRTKEHAQSLLQQALTKDNLGREFIFVMDWTANLFAAQSNASRILFGDLVNTPLQHLLTRECEVQAVVTCGGAAALNPGREFNIPAHLKCSNEEGLFYLSFMVDPASYFLVLAGRKT